MVALNQTSYNIRIAMRQARVSTYIPRAELALMLRISEPDLTRFETGATQVPLEIMQLLFSNAYTMLRARYINNRYREHAKRLRELGALGIPDDNADIIDDK